jgi:hypothetical protein
MCVLISSSISVWKISHSKNNWARYDQKRILGFMYRCYSCQMLIKLEYSPVFFSKDTQISNFMEIRPVGTELFYADGQTDVTKLKVAFRNYTDAP